MRRNDAGSSVYQSKVPKMQVSENDIGWPVDKADGLKLTLIPLDLLAHAIRSVSDLSDMALAIRRFEDSSVA
jgi:hypothetical protein